VLKVFAHPLEGGASVTKMCYLSPRTPVTYVSGTYTSFRTRALTGAHCQEGGSPSQAIALRACNRM